MVEVFQVEGFGVESPGLFVFLVADADHHFDPLGPHPIAPQEAGISQIGGVAFGQGIQPICDIFILIKDVIRRICKHNNGIQF